MAVKVYDYSNSLEYTYDSNKIEVSEGIAKLKSLSDYDGLVGYWKFEDDVLDSSGQGNNGTNYGATFVDGKVGRALSFDGDDDNINCGNDPSLNITDAITVEAWVYTDVAQKGKFLVEKGTSTYLWGLYLTGNSTSLHMYIRNSIGDVHTAGYDSDFIGKWVHVMGTFDGQYIKLYVNGELKNTYDWGSSQTIASNSESVIVGAWYQQGAYFNGTIDEVAIWNRALLETEIQSIYNSGTGRHLSKYSTDKPTIEPTDLFEPTEVDSWDSFLETLGIGNQGSVGYNLYKTDKSNKYYWNGSEWTTGGDENNYNSANVISANIGSFDANPDKIGFIAYLISNGEQQVELDENQITYTMNQNPLVNAGSNKTCKDNDTIAPFSDCSFSDPDGSIVKAEYKIDGEVDIWTEISKGSYGTLLEAVQAWTYQFNNSGIKTVRLQVTDDEGATASDSLDVTVNKFQVTFNIRDNQGNHLSNFNFNPGDGSGWLVKDSPFVYEYEYNSGGYTIIIDKAGYSAQTQTVIVTSDHSEFFTLLVLVDTSELSNKVDRILGLCQENYRLFNPVYDKRMNLIAGTIKIYPTANNCDNDTNELAEYRITAIFDNKSRMTSYKVKKI